MNLEQIRTQLEEDFAKELRLKFTIENIYIDFGENWKADTIIVEQKDNTTYQALSPANIIQLENGEGKLVYEILHDKISKRGW